MKSSSGTLGGGCTLFSSLAVREFKIFVRQTSFKAVQCMTGDSSLVIRQSGREDARGPVRNGGSRGRSLIVSRHNCV
jgi:hypothetical protein